jgi:hypothetical protein
MVPGSDCQPQTLAGAAGKNQSTMSAKKSSQRCASKQQLEFGFRVAWLSHGMVMN